MSQVLTLRGKLKFGERVLLRSNTAQLGGIVSDLYIANFLHRYQTPPDEPWGKEVEIGQRIQLWSIATHRFRVMMPEEGIRLGDMPTHKLQIRESEELQVTVEALDERDDGREVTIYASVNEP